MIRLSVSTFLPHFVLLGIGSARPQVLKVGARLFSALLSACSLTGVALAQSTTPPTGNRPWTTLQLNEKFWAEGACVTDVNGDGLKDVLCGPYWYEGPELQNSHRIYPDDDTFSPQPDNSAIRRIPGFEGFLSGRNGYSNNFISFAFDFNRDGAPDYLVIGVPGKEAVWYENPRGRNELWTRHVIIDKCDNESPMLVDLNGDGVPELLCMTGGQLGYASQNSDDPYAKWTWHNVSGSPDKRFYRYTHGIGYGDINGDGRLDILEGQGWWEQPESWDGSTPWVKHSASFGKGAQMFGYDVNGDGRTDIITSLEAHGYGLAWFEQLADGTWQRHLLMGSKPGEGETSVVFSQPHALALGDINRDGLLDIVTGKRFWAHGPDGDVEPKASAVLYWFELKRKDGQASFVPHLIDDNSGVGTQVSLADLNGDGMLDVVVGNKLGCFVHLQNN